jgi:uncharacterized delta-60 repeat protein
MRRQHTTNRDRSRARRAAVLRGALAAVIGIPADAGAAVAPDPGFGGSGLVLTDFTGGEDAAGVVATSPGGGVVAAGFGELGDPERPHVAGFAFARYLDSGAPDPTFSGDGRTLADFGFVNQGAEAMAVGGDGGIVAAGTIATFDGTTSSIGVARLLPDGAPDPDFGADGLVVLHPGTLSAVGDVAVDANGRAIVLGAASSSRGFRPLVIRLRPDGTLDPSFGSGGIARFGKPFADLYESLAIDRRGRLLLGGRAPRRTGDPGAAVRRMTASGDLDDGYGRDGVARPFGGGDGELADLALDGSRVLAAATCVCAGGRDDDFEIARLGPGGRRDRSFGAGGRTVIGFGANDAEASSIAVGPDGRAVAAGSVRIGGSERWALARVTPDGDPDRSFGRGGRISADIGPGVDGARDVAVDRQSRIYAAGLGAGPDGSDFAVVRFRQAVSAALTGATAARKQSSSAPMQAAEIRSGA